MSMPPLSRPDRRGAGQRGVQGDSIGIIPWVIHPPSRPDAPDVQQYAVLTQAGSPRPHSWMGRRVLTVARYKARTGQSAAAQIMPSLQRRTRSSQGLDSRLGITPTSA